MDIPKDRFYTKEHEWASIEGGTAYVGITDYAQSSLGDITFIGLPKIGDMIKQTEFCATVESVKAASDVYAPLSGKVTAVNKDLVAHPELVNKHPYDKGQIFVMEISNPDEKANLMDEEAYRSYVEGLSK
ncbi:MAG: glycine cleavage system protein GcvH [Candidatus Omnitrophica bacterium]|nr:glycine cleavage system protein GcvH [Candidatus Omnitrophota bacterium]